MQNTSGKMLYLSSWTNLNYFFDSFLELWNFLEYLAVFSHMSKNAFHLLTK